MSSKLPGGGGVVAPAVLGSPGGPGKLGLVARSGARGGSVPDGPTWPCCSCGAGAAFTRFASSVRLAITLWNAAVCSRTTFTTATAAAALPSSSRSSTRGGLPSGRKASCIRSRTGASASTSVPFAAAADVAAIVACEIASRMRWSCSSTPESAPVTRATGSSPFFPERPVRTKASLISFQRAFCTSDIRPRSSASFSRFCSAPVVSVCDSLA